MEQFGKFILGLILVVVSVIFGGFVLSKLWDWFMVYAFALPSISIPVALGISMTVTLITGAKESKDDMETCRDFFEKIIKIVARQAMFLLMGWIVYLFL